LGNAANNLGDRSGNTSLLQRLTYQGKTYSRVSAESQRFALRYRWQELGLSVNRKWDPQGLEFTWESETSFDRSYLDDDALGFMLAEGAKSKDEKGTTSKRKGALDWTDAISLTPYEGDLSFGAKAGQKSNTSLHNTEQHRTAYQAGWSLKPSDLNSLEHLETMIQSALTLGRVAGNHSRHLFDFSAESVIFRVSAEPCPRILEAFSSINSSQRLHDLIEMGAVDPAEIYIAGAIALNEGAAFSSAGVKSYKLNEIAGVIAGLFNEEA
jgi:CRISPR-associated protein Cst2